MAEINAVTDLSYEGDIAVITLNSPPVNALSTAVKTGLFNAFTQAMDDDRCKAIVLICEGRTFIAGADLTAIGSEQTGPGVPEMQAKLENSSKPTIAAIHGTALGGGLETALTLHYRVAVPSAKMGLPEVNLGLLPGAGGTQRLPRIVGVEAALELVTSGRQVSAKDALAVGLIDEIVPEGQLREGAIAFARRIVAENRPLVRVRDNNQKLEAARGHPEIFENFRKANARKFRGFLAPEYNIRAIEAAVNAPDFDAGKAKETEYFQVVVKSPESAAQLHVFFAERAAGKIPDIADDTPLIDIKSVGVIGAGTMGGGIAMVFANAGLPVTLIEQKQEALDRGLATILKNYERTAQRGGMTADDVKARMGLITPSLDYQALASVDLVIEAVFESMDVKMAVFKELDAVCKPGAILATNTSMLNIDEIAASTKRPESVIGLHFFSPANVMRLLEVVRGEKTSKSVVATAMKLAKKIGKLGVLVGVAFGFVGNRMLMKRQDQAQKLLMAGAMPWEVDKVLFDFGFPMGPFAMGDLAGLDIGWDKARSKGETVRDVLAEMGRFGQKTGAGFYDYDADRNPTPSPVTEKIVKDMLAKNGLTPRKVSEEEILDRLILPMINEGAKILEEGKALRSSDIDMVWITGYGWPIYRGGPMYYADQLGLDKVLAKLKAFQAANGDDFKPAALLEKLAAEGKKFSDFKVG